MSGLKRTEKKRSLGQQLRDARYATLDNRAVSDEAKRLVDLLAEQVAAWEIRYGHRTRQRRSGAEKLRTAVAGFLGDLLLARKPGDKADGWVYRSMQATTFTDKSVSHRTFVAVVDGLKDLRFIEHKPSAILWDTDFNNNKLQSVRHRFASRFRASPKLLKLSSDYGLTDRDVVEHFVESLPDNPLALKATSRRRNGQKERGKALKFKPTHQTERLRLQILSLNEFLDGHVIRGGTHRYFIRIFNNGDNPDFSWNKGGRLYSPGEDSYQQLSRDARLRMTIDGERLCEIDVRASYLTILHARHDVPFQVSQEHDPYDIPGLDRSVVKSWVAIFFGSKKLPERWPTETRKEYAEEHKGRNLSKDFPIKKVGMRVIEKFPLLARWNTLKETWADLMWLESKAIVATMLELMEKGVPSLPIHDSLLVPVAKAKVTQEVLRHHYHKVCGVHPVLKLHQPT